jgi:muramoyltetrapeptide carboxypeptidase
MESLRLKGVLDLVKGIIVGKFDSKEMNESIEAFLKDYLINYNIPVICNVDFGHVFPILTLPIGRMAKLECFNNEIKFIVNKKNRG